MHIEKTRCSVKMFAAAVVLLITSGIAGAQVKTESGAVEGTTSPDASVRIYRGIPFAAAPVGELRWQAPRPVAPWQGVRKATAFGNRCMQAPHLLRHDLPRRGERRLPVPQRVDAREGRHRAPAGHGVDLRRRLPGRLCLRAAAGRREARGQGCRGRELQLPARRLRLLRSSGADEGVGPQRVGQLRPARPGGGAAVGEEEHRRVRRRSGQGDDLR